MKVKESTRGFSVAGDHDHLPELTVTQDDVDRAHDEVFGPPEKPRGVPITAFVDSEWSQLFEEYHRQRLVHVLSNNVLLVRHLYS
jgi:hypothetical protein